MQTHEKVIKDFLLEHIKRLIKNPESLIEAGKGPDIDSLSVYDLMIVLVRAFQLNPSAITRVDKISLIYEMILFLVKDPSLRREFNKHKNIKRDILEKIFLNQTSKIVNLTNSEKLKS